MKSAVTLIETIVYIGIASIILVASTVLIFTWISKEIRQNISNQITSTVTFSSGQLTYYTKRANRIDDGTIYSSTGTGKLVLSYATSPSVTFDVVDRVVTLGELTTTTQSLRITVGTSTPSYLTGEHQRVTAFHIIDLSPSPTVTTTAFFLNVSHINPTSAKTYDAHISTSSTVTLRAQ